MRVRNKIDYEVLLDMAYLLVEAIKDARDAESEQEELIRDSSLRESAIIAHDIENLIILK